jgi:2-polyprenyl-3-methyl-5-hydroxy-6-metoxy-1,4-benzoquinol methylase
MSVEEQVREHFDADAGRFDAIYDDEKSPLERWVDTVWRGVVRRRFDFTLGVLEPLEGKNALDVGCGSGRYCIAYARRGARRVVGVDFAPAMIDLAIKHADRAGVGDCCDFRVGTFPGAVPDGPFDVSTAMGFFDYVDKPVQLVADMRNRTRQTMVMSFPKAREWRAPLRRLRFAVNRCPLFLYSEPRVQAILDQAGVTNYEWVDFDRDYVVVAHV